MNKSGPGRGIVVKDNDGRLRHREDGKYAEGTMGGPGVTKEVARCRRQYLELVNKTITEEDFGEILAALITQAKKGKPWAIREVLDRTLGKPKITADIDVTNKNEDPQVIINNVSNILGISIEDSEELLKDRVKEINEKQSTKSITSVPDKLGER